MHRFFVPFAAEFEAFPVEIEVTQAETVHHIRQVMRMKPGDAVVAVDGVREIAYTAELTAVDKHALGFRLLERLPSPEDSIPSVTLGVALIKEQRWDWLLQKVTELGVRCIVPLSAERCVVQVREADKKLARWRGVVQNAAEQSEGLFVPEITTPMSLSEFAGLTEASPLRLLLQERGDRPSLQSILAKTGQPRRLAAAIGPEGGWSDKELQLFRFAGFQPVSLGQRILRSETAAMALMSALVCAYDMGSAGEDTPQRNSN